MATLDGVWDRIVTGVYRYILEPTNLTQEHVRPVLGQIPQFLTVLLIFFVLAHAFVWVLGKTLMSPRRVDPMIRKLAEKLMIAALMFIGFAVALMVFGINIFSLAVTLGLIGAALALGLQNTVANLMGGIALASDRPFEVGDRIQVGEFWGDVEEIGLRSTRILTTKREYVVIPNRLMDEREIWNYTRRFPELRVDVDVTISYDSDRSLAKALMIKIAEEHPDVLAFPKPRVLLKAFGDSGVVLELRCFIPDARRMRIFASELREAIKDEFDENRVEIPYPYRTLVYKSELPPPRHAGEEDTRPAPLREPGPRRVLVATAGTTPALNKAQTVVRIARQLDADLVVAYITPRDSLVTSREGERAADIFAAAAEPEGVAVKLAISEGTVIECVDELVRQEGCGAVIMGASRNPVLLAWKSANVEERLRAVLDVPVIIVPPSLEVDPAAIQRARDALDALAPLPGAPARDDGEEDDPGGP